jgi:hypothetical protein
MFQNYYSITLGGWVMVGELQKLKFNIMKIYIIKHKGANTFGNLCARYHRAKYGGTYVLRGHFYQRLKDAKLSLKHTTNNPEIYEIVTLEISKPKYAKCISTLFPDLIEVGKKYKILAEQEDKICIIDKTGNLDTFNKSYFEI